MRCSWGGYDQQNRNLLTPYPLVNNYSLRSSLILTVLLQVHGVLTRSRRQTHCTGRRPYIVYSTESIEETIDLGSNSFLCGIYRVISRRWAFGMDEWMDSPRGSDSRIFILSPLRCPDTPTRRRVQCSRRRRRFDNRPLLSLCLYLGYYRGG